MKHNHTGRKCDGRTRTTPDFTIKQGVTGKRQTGKLVPVLPDCLLLTVKTRSPSQIRVGGGELEAGASGLSFTRVECGMGF